MTQTPINNKGEITRADSQIGSDGYHYDDGDNSKTAPDNYRHVVPIVLLGMILPERYTQI